MTHKIRCNKLRVVVNCLLYLLAAVLMIFYISILVLAQTPKVSSEYYEYYITQDLKSWGGNDAFDYQLGDVLYFNDSNSTIASRMSSGWSVLESNACWTVGETAKIWFSSLPCDDLCFTIKVAAIRPGCTVELYANNVLIGNIDQDAVSDGKYEVMIPSDVIDNGDLEVLFQIYNPSGTDTDSRQMGILVSEVVIDEWN